jgi:hypothetical protein
VSGQQRFKLRGIVITVAVVMICFAIWGSGFLVRWSLGLLAVLIAWGTWHMTAPED